ncbi:HAD family hydrolase [uncultured Anaerococcus sp.]|uniref:HAD family hydrolase n=1 Tax=uncultured Anaerococcus sp. TaxID=293428 RepID=UPI00262DBC07|nr:HAD family hydrolase [uncultured Anaerococcus sp.]
MYIFDIDGTLLYTIDTIAYFINETLKIFGLDSCPKDKVEAFVGNGPVVLCEKTLDYVGADKDPKFRKDFLDTYNKAYDDNPAYLTKAYDGVKESLYELKKTGKPLVCFSNKPDETCKKVIPAVFGEGFFDDILGFRGDYERKPSPAGIMILKEKFGVEFSDIIYFGDSEVDMKCGKNAGIFTVGVSWGFRNRKVLEDEKPDLIIDDPSELVIRRA